MKKKIGLLLIVTILSLIILYIGLFPYINQEWPFIPYFDMRAQYRQFLSEFERILKNSIDYRTLPFWSWNFFLGNNFWASKSIQLLGDVFAYISLMLKTHPYNQILYITILKFVVSATTFYYYLSYQGMSNKQKIIGSLGFAFSSYLIRFTEQAFFMTFYALFPLYLVGIERIIDKKRPYFFIVMTSLLIISNYYLFYTTTIFSVVYFIIRMMEKEMPLRESLKEFYSFVFYYLIGFGMTLFIILPSFYAIIENPRIGSNTYNFWFYPELTNYFNIFMSYLIPMQTSLGNVYSSNYYNLESYIWTGSIFALLLPQIFFSKERQYKKYKWLFAGIFTLLILPIGGSILHGFSEPSLRWQFIIVFGDTQ